MTIDRRALLQGASALALLGKGDLSEAEPQEFITHNSRERVQGVS